MVGGKRAKNGPKRQKFCLSHSISQEPYIIWLRFKYVFALYLRYCRSYHQDFDNDIYRCLSLFLFFKKCNLASIKFFFPLLAYFNIFLNNYLFFKFMNKCQKEILRCALPSHVCDFLSFTLFFHLLACIVECVSEYIYFV